MSARPAQRQSSFKLFRLHRKTDHHRLKFLHRSDVSLEVEIGEVSLKGVAHYAIVVQQVPQHGNFDLQNFGINHTPGRQHIAPDFAPGSPLGAQSDTSSGIHIHSESSLTRRRAPSASAFPGQVVVLKGTRFTVRFLQNFHCGVPMLGMHRFSSSASAIGETAGAPEQRLMLFKGRTIGGRHWWQGMPTWKRQCSGCSVSRAGNESDAERSALHAPPRNAHNTGRRMASGPGRRRAWNLSR